MIPIGLALAGPMAEAVSVNFWFAMGGALTAALGLAALCLPAVMSLEESFKAQAV
ncbi:MAG: hypothetical protein K6U03_03240 [Firmicutes bacterium]|nr:hypothetical protein [Bacillota bacterium]